MTTWSFRKPSLSARIIHHFRNHKMFYRFSIGIALFTLFVGGFQFSWLVALLSTFVIYLVCGGWRFLRVLYLTLPRDVRAAITLFKGLRFLKKIKNQNYRVPDLFNEQVQKYGDKVAFIFEEKRWTFKEVDMYSNQVANYFQSIGYKKGDVVALFMENRPEVVFFWLGLSKIGVNSALINHNLKKESLIHCVSIVNSKGLVYSADIEGAIIETYNSLKGVQLFRFGSDLSDRLPTSVNLEDKLKDCSEKRPIKDFEMNYNDILFYIYTSGTTGRPKACVIRHLRFCMLTVGFGTALHISSKDTLYNVLPLYHSSAGIAGVGAVFIFGVTMVIRRKFSASRFWDECIKYRATYFHYIGELCRYLLAQPVKETDKMHSIRMANGNGLRPQIWKEFQSRFNIPLIGEFYAATESNAPLLNFTGYPGAVGFLPVTVPQTFLPIRIFKMDPSGDELLRGPDGLCVPCQPGEVGQIIGKIDQRNFTRRFDGYLNRNATNKKIAQDVVKKGDEWFLSGDTLFWDELGYFFFHDRLGDTFRWHGENVSTAEVESIMSTILGLNSVVVFGVEVPGCEGRAGMAAIEDPDNVTDIKFLGKQLSESLPSYARPIFLRITASVDTTGTFKFKKTRLRKEGFNVTAISDKLFYFDQPSGEYRSLTKEIFQKFENREIRI